MAATIIDGKAAAAKLRARVADTVRDLVTGHDLVPGLAVVLVGENPASQVYVRNKHRFAEEVGMKSFMHVLPAETPQDDLLALIDRLNEDPAVHGILVQLPLPAHIEARTVINAVDPGKDVDGFSIQSVGLLASGQPGLVPCTPWGCLLMLREYVGDLTGMKALVIGRSDIVGKPMAHLLLQENCTVTIAHSRTRDLPAECREADIVVAAIGRPEFVKGDWVKPGAAVIDVGINRLSTDDGKSRLVGDVDFEAAAAVAGYITPVPGGVGPMTIACLLSNTLKAACLRAGLPYDPR